MDIYISPHAGITQFECGSRVRDFPLLVKEKKDFSPLAEGRFDQIQEVKILIKRWYGWHQLHLTVNLERAIAQFLREYHHKRDESFDCYAFANLAGNLPLHDKLWLNAFWQMQPISPEKIAGERIIFFVDQSRERFGHAAIHLGQGYFLSVQGAAGTLSVSLLPDLQSLYQDHPDIVGVVPKDKSEFQDLLTTIMKA